MGLSRMLAMQALDKVQMLIAEKSASEAKL